jgi:hypothetical protein
MNTIETLRSHLDTLQHEYGVKSIGVFGSAARGEAGTSSDVDLLVHFEAENFKNFMSFCIYVENLLGKRVDVIPQSSRLSVQFLNAIKEDLIRI